MAKRARRSHIFAKQRDGWYVEPPWVSARLFETEWFGARSNSLICDPACGGGNILSSAADFGYRVIGFDVVDRFQRGDAMHAYYRKFDFLNGDKMPTRRPITSIVTNPPYDYVREYCERSCQIATYKVAVVCLLRRLPAAHWLETLPLQTVYMLSPRPSMPPGEYIRAGHKPGGGTQDFVVLIFNKRMRDRPRYPRVGWLHRDGGDTRDFK